MKYLNILLEGLIFSLLSGISVCASAEIKGKCSEIQSYLKGQNIENAIEKCVVNDQSQIIELSIDNSQLSEENVNKLLSYDTIEKLKYWIDIGSVEDDLEERGPKFKDFPSNLKSLSNLKELHLFYDAHELTSHTYGSVIRTKIKENVLKDLKIKSLTLEGIAFDDSTLKAINSLSNLESLTLTECALTNVDLDNLKNNKKLTDLYIGYYDKNYYDGNYGPKKYNLSNIKSLKKFTVKYITVSQNEINELASLTFLEELNMKNLIFNTSIEKPLNLSFDKFSNLSKLTIDFGFSRTYKDEEFELKTVDLKLPKTIKTLEFGGADITDENINTISSITNIKELDIDISESKNNINLEKLSNLKNLEYLKINGYGQTENLNIKYNNNLKKLYLKSFILPESFENVVFALDQLEELSLTQCKKDKPLNLDSIGNLKKLNTLIIYNNYNEELSLLKEIPKSLVDLTNLKTLYIVEQNVVTIPEEIGNIKNLEKLNISGQKLKSEIPTSLNNLKKLKEVEIRGNISGKTLTNDSIEQCIYSYSKTLCVAKDMPCLRDYGLKTCDGNNDVTNKTTITTTTTTTKPSSTKPSTSTSTGRCGKDYGGAVCKSGYCCSKYGYCGTTEDHCELTKGCQSEFGDCSTKKSGQCGKGIGSCPSGYCCSKYGWCGKSSDHCLASKGCQSSFGECKNDNESVKGKCGNGIGKCPSGYCCSKYGWCGKTLDHCSVTKGCQSSFGECKKESVNGKCGKGNGICPSGYCCSKYGWCGKSKDYCGTGCQSEFGKCD